ncbi:MAG TPA: hypothetical protein VGO17_06880 [Aurantimonas sp.]|jgi:hypothetical protein|nr:hypothetical protein [Aurantimonas sp.]
MGGTSFIPIVIAGLVGLLIGGLLGPDFDDFEEAVSQRVAELQAPIGEIRADVAALNQRVPEAPTAAVAGVGQGVTALQTRVEQLAGELVARTDALSQTMQQQAGQAGTNAAEAVSALQTRVDQLAADLAARTDALSQTVQEQAGQAGNNAAEAVSGLQARIDQLSAELADRADAVTEAAGEQASADARALAAQVGATGAILLPEQLAIFGTNPVLLSAISEEAATATLAAVGSEPQEVAAGGSVDLGDGCSVTLAGVAAGAAYLSSEGCEGVAPPASAEAPAAAAEAAAQPEAAEIPTPAASAETPAAVPAAEAPTPETADTGALPVGATAIYGDTRIFISGVTDTDATLFVAGGAGGRERVAIGAPFDAGNGCTVTVEAIENGRVTLSAEGCDPDAAPAAPAPAEEAAPAPAAAPASPAAVPAPPAASPEPAVPAAEEAATPQAPAAAGAPGGITTGQTAILGEQRVFLSGVSGTEATLHFVGYGRRLMPVGARADFSNGCTVTVDRIDGGTVYLSAEGC